MSRSKRFERGKPYLLTDMKEMVFDEEPAIYVGRKDSDMERPTLCAVCGQPLGADGYTSFFLTGPNGHGMDMMIGNGCIKDRIKEEAIGIQENTFMDTWNRVIAEFPKSGRWYGTFLHHSIAKPYVRDKTVAEDWNESVLRLPGVRFIMKTIDDLRDEGWDLDAEKVLECGHVDLLATHPERGTIVFDWKSDQSFDSYDSYVAQINEYMLELSRAGKQKITGYILWIRDERRQHVPFNGSIESFGGSKGRSYVPSSPIRCTLNIEMDGGEGVRRKRITENSYRRPYGDEVSFYIPPCEPSRYGYKFRYFEASPYREDERTQAFDTTDAEGGFPVRFICSKKRHVFTLTAKWERIRPFECTLSILPEDKDPHSYFFVRSMSKIDDEGNDYAEFEASEISKRLRDKILTHASLLNNEEYAGLKTEWDSRELSDGMVIRIPCINDHTSFPMMIGTIPDPEKKKVEKPMKKPTTASVSSPGFDVERVSDTLAERPLSAIIEKDNPQEVHQNSTEDPLFKYLETSKSFDPAELSFTPGRIYESGGRYYGIYKRKESDRFNANGKVDVAEVDIQGNKISDLEWRYVYKTKGGKEYIFGLENREWKIYTKNVLVGLTPEGMERYG